IGRQWKALAVDGDEALFHRLEQSRLRFRARAVHLIDEHDVGEQRPAPELELAALGVEHVHAGEIRRHQVRCSLNPLELTAEHASERVAEKRLAESRRTLDQHVPRADERDRERVDHLVEAIDDRANLLAEKLLDLVRLRRHPIASLAFNKVLWSRTKSTA